MSSSEQRQDTITKRKQLSRSDAIVGDDDNKVKPTAQTHEPFKMHSSTLSQSKDSYKDMVGVDVLQFVEITLHKNAKDREFLLGIEEEMKKIVANNSIQFHFFQPMSSYNRMLVHRVATLFGLIHNVDQTGERVVVTKQEGITKIPDFTFESLIKHSNFYDRYQFPKRSVQSFDESTNAGRFPPVRNFRNRFHTSTGEYNGELVRGRRARSFETGGEWYGFGGSAGTQQFRQHSTNMEFLGTSEAMSSNCSSNASSSAIPAQMQMQSFHLPLYSPGQFVPYMGGNESSLLSPSSASAYSEPMHPYQPPASAVGGKFAESAGNQQLLLKEEEHSEQHPHIPSLFSVQPTPPQMFYQQFYSPQYQQAYIQYPTPNAYGFYPNYYPLYPPQQPIIQPHPLLEENHTRHISEKLNTMNLDATEPTKEAANGQPIGEKDDQQKNGHLEKSTSDNNVQNGQNNADTNHTEVSQPNKMRDNSNKAAQ